MMKLIDEAERAVAHDTAFAIRQFRQRASFDLDFAGTQGVQAAQYVEKCTFSGAGSTDNGYRAPTLEAEADVAQHIGAQAALGIGLGDAGGAQDNIVCRGHHSYLKAAAGWVRDARQAGYRVANRQNTKAIAAIQPT